MLSPDQLRPLAAPYGLPPETLAHVASSQNHVYRAQRADGRQVILRISVGRHRQPSEVLAELEWIAHLATFGVAVCRPLAAQTGEFCVVGAVDGKECVVTCFEHSPGSRITPELLTPLLYEKLGRLLGSMHTAALSFNAGAKGWARPHWYESRLIRQDLDALGGQLSETFRRSVADLVQSLRRHPASTDAYGPVHGDVSFGNCFLNEEDLWIFDFDNCEQGYFIQDLATVLYDSIYCKVLNKFADDGLTVRMKPLWDAVWAGYQETGVVKEWDAGQLRKFFLLREAVIYMHYHRVFDVSTVSD